MSKNKFSKIIAGTMSWGNWGKQFNSQQMIRLMNACLESSVTTFDHADIYGGGDCEDIFSEAIHMNDEIREKIILQSKCGIRKGMFDFSKEHILGSVDGILKRLRTA